MPNLFGENCVVSIHALENPRLGEGDNGVKSQTIGGQNVIWPLPFKSKLNATGYLILIPFDLVSTLYIWPLLAPAFEICRFRQCIPM